jgi:uncharacterized 2Fe-2S/4Fe-4S cluster protein (DUF4445 family)
MLPSAKKYRMFQDPKEDRPFGHRSIRLEGYTGGRPHMTRQQHHEMISAEGMMTVTVSTAPGYPEIICIENGDTTCRSNGLAIDLGTTTVVGVLINLESGSVIAQASALNSQITYGEELITRIAVAKDRDGLKNLQLSAVRSINTVIEQLLSQSGTGADSIIDVCIAGNTVMIYLLNGMDPRHLDLAHAEVSHRPVIVKGHGLGLDLPEGTYVYCLPNVSRYVGGDAIGDVLVSGLHRSDELSLVIDLGTNGEIVFGNKDWMASASCASGPAFEGAGISSGMRGMRGAIDHVTIDPATGHAGWTTIGDEPPKGICGSGIIDAAAAMAQAGILDFSGKFVEGKTGVRKGRDGLEFVLVSKEETATGRDIVITAQDMMYLMDSKAATCGAIGVLMKKYRIKTADVRHVYLAGAFGAYVDTRSIIRFGIIPDFFGAQFHLIGNGSLAGAAMALLSDTERQAAETITKKMAYIDLLVDSDFIEEYSAAIYIPGKKEYFSHPP